MMDLPPDDEGPRIDMAPGAMQMVLDSASELVTPARKPQRLPDLS